MKHILMIIPTLVGAMLLSGCATGIIGATGLSTSNPGTFDYDDSTARNTQEEAARESQWAADQATAAETAAANQTTVDNANAAAAASAASAAVGIGQ